MDKLRSEIVAINSDEISVQYQSLFEDQRKFALNVLDSQSQHVVGQLKENARIWENSSSAPYRQLGACELQLAHLLEGSASAGGGVPGSVPAPGSVHANSVPRLRATIAGSARGAGVNEANVQASSPNQSVLVANSSTNDSSFGAWWNSMPALFPPRPSSAGAGGAEREALARADRAEREALARSANEFMSRLRPSIEHFMDRNQNYLHLANILNLGYIVLSGYSNGGPGFIVPDIAAITLAAGNITNTSKTILLDLLISDLTRGGGLTLEIILKLVSPLGVTGTDGGKLIERLRTLDVRKMNKFSLYTNLKKDKAYSDYATQAGFSTVVALSKSVKSTIGDPNAIDAMGKCLDDDCSEYDNMLDTLIAELASITGLTAWNPFAFIYYLLTAGFLGLSYYFARVYKRKKPLTEAERVEFGRRRTLLSRRRKSNKSSKRTSFGRRRKSSKKNSSKKKKTSFGKKRKVSRKKKNSRK